MTTHREHLKQRTEPFTSWEVPEGFETFDIVQVVGDLEYHFGAAHVYDDGKTRVVVRPGNREWYGPGRGFYMEIETLIGNPGQQFSNVHAALRAGRDAVIELVGVHAARTHAETLKAVSR
jgi:hypothetical protein